MKKYIIIPALMCVAVMFAQTIISPQMKLRMAEQYIYNYYVDTLNEDQLVENAINGMLKELDPHSSYSNAEETKAMNERLDGSFSGVGISYNMTQDTLYVIQTVSGGPSEKVGILAGDRILEVNDTLIAGKKMKTSDIMKKLRGPKGTKVNVKVLRRSGSVADTIWFDITRDDIPVNSVDAAYMADDKTGYIKLNQFGLTTPKEVIKSIKELQKKGMKNLIIDLTDNGGGYLSAAVDLVSELLEPGQLVVYTSGENSPRRDLKSSPSNGGNPLMKDGRVVVMVNQYSASASEITAGAIQDWDRGVIVGRRTFGKGLVQRPIPFPDGSMIRLTTAHYYTPTGRNIQKPYEKGNSESYQHDIVDRYNNGELTEADSIRHDDALKVQTLRNGRTIYGGGGITPDKFIPIDTTGYSKYYRDIQAKGLLNQYSIRYMEANKSEIKKKYKTEKAFVNNFVITDDILEGLTNLATQEGIAFNQEEFDRSKGVFSRVLKALIGRDIYDNETFYKVINLEDPIYKEALDIINSEEYDILLNK
jgi:carboxyl-terminal processing protease